MSDWAAYLLETENLLVLASVVIALLVVVVPGYLTGEGAEKQRLVGPPEPPPKKRVFTIEELATWKGHKGKPVLLACKGVIYHVDPTHYGPGAGYSVFSGHDISRHLGKMWVGVQEANQPWTDLTESETKILNDWEEKFQQKYDIWGWLEESFVDPKIDPAALDAIIPTHKGGEEEMISNLTKK
eukprot:TRINITY_DN20793_c0_g1_i1.p1 TRINITY_DN20793_c0_g1~~TRINITY_DN20793_c0_g1_i1.p1  ORF type:complete len:184 (+),score=36.37 TRINITY_DN20793_c0_g1_i1:58-609(+)